MSVIKIKIILIIRNTISSDFRVESFKDFDIYIVDKINKELLNFLTKKDVIIISSSRADLDLAISNNFAFFPILPNKKEESWTLFYEEASKIIFSDMYKAYQKLIIEAFKNE